MKSIFTYKSYRAYVRECLESRGLRSGMKRKAALALGVHTTFISQIVNGKAELSLEQAEKLNEFFKHSEEESEYFIDLVIYERAGAESLKARFAKRLDSKYAKNLRIKDRISPSQSIAESDKSTFYSSFVYSLIHVLVSVPDYNSRKKVCAAIGVNSKIVHTAIDFLIKLDVVRENKGKLTVGPQHIHLDKSSSHIRQHHINWRNLTIQKIPFSDPSDLHYSLVFSCSKKDGRIIKEKILNTLNEISEIVGPSKEEETYVYCFDFFKWLDSNPV